MVNSNFIIELNIDIMQLRVMSRNFIEIRISDSSLLSRGEPLNLNESPSILQVHPVCTDIYHYFNANMIVERPLFLLLCRISRYPDFC